MPNLLGLMNLISEVALLFQLLDSASSIIRDGRTTEK